MPRTKPSKLLRHLAACLFATAAVQGAVAGGTLRCVSLDYPPLVSLNTAQQAHGIAVDVVRETMRKGGWKVEVEVLPWARALDLMQRGQRDCIFTIFKTPEREEFLDFSTKVLLNQPIALYAHKDSGLRFSGDLGDMADKSFLVVHAVNYGKRFEAERSKLQTIQAYSAAQAFEKLAQQQGDLVISNVYLAAYQLNAAGTAVASNVVQLQPPVETVASYMAFAKGKHPQALRDFDAHISQVLHGNNHSTFERILDRNHIPKGQRASLLK